MKKHLPEKWIYHIAELDKFTILPGFLEIWWDAGTKIRKQLQPFNMQPKLLHAELELFYGLF